MTIGNKIKLIRNFRGLTQKELGIKIGFDEKSADNRIAQYETNYRVPKKDLLKKIAKVLNVNPNNFLGAVSGSAEDIMLTFFWMDEENRGMINLFPLIKNQKKPGTLSDTAVHYNDSDAWPAHSPIGMYLDYGIVDNYIKKWSTKKEELKNGKITNNDYLEWKLNWPKTYDN